MEISLDQIEVGERFRKDYGDLNQLAYSIKKNGQITPIAVGTSKLKINRETDLPYVLIAGGRRFKVIKDFLKWPTIKCRVYDTPLSILDFRSIELAENFDRKDLSYPEELSLKCQINDLQIKIHGEKVAPTGPGWSRNDTARLLKESPATLSRDLKLADAIQKFPELGLDKCKNKAEALKRLTKIGKTLVNHVQAREYETKVGPSDKVFNKLSSSYIIGDCFDVIKKVPSNSMDFVEIDPPYGIDLKSNKKNNDCVGYEEIDSYYYSDFMANIIKESVRILKESGWLICWLGPSWYEMIRDCLKKSNLIVNDVPGIWTKPQGQTLQPEHILGNSYEMFFYARKSTARLQKPGRLNVFDFKPVPHTSKYHPTQRPLDLILELYSTFVGPNTNGFIPFLGSGVGLIASHILKINTIGTDLNPVYKDGYLLELRKLLERSNA